MGPPCRIVVVVIAGRRRILTWQHSIPPPRHYSLEREIGCVLCTRVVEARSRFLFWCVSLMPPEGEGEEVNAMGAVADVVVVASQTGSREDAISSSQ